jgi:hypothetical protein
MAINIQNVTQEQLDRCHRIEDLNNHTVFYQVDNERGEVDPDGNTIEYTVRFVPGRGFTCTCKAGQEGFRNCRSTCKHCRWAAAHAEAYRQERREQSQIESYVRQGCDRETATRVVYSQPTLYTDAQVKHDQARCQRQAFSILR